MSFEATKIRLGLRIATVAAAASAWSATLEAGDAKAREQVQRAISYLDARQEAWSKFAGSQRGKGSDATSCVSCHTGLTYALARPSLGRFVKEPEPPAPRQKMLAGVGLRAEHWAELDSPKYGLMYDFDDRKKVESLGTEAVFQALLLAREDAARGRTEPSAASRNAFRHLWATQVKEGGDAGSWDWLNFGLEPWEGKGSRFFGATLAAMAVASAPGYQAGPLDKDEARGLASLGDYLRRRFPEESLHNRLWILLASSRREGPLSADQKRVVIDRLLAAQRADGGWSLSTLGDFKRVDGTAASTDSDGYATGLVVYALLAEGLPADTPGLAIGLRWLRSHQQPDGSWPGISVNKKRDPATFVGKLMTDAATAFTALAIVEAESP
jgi:squalene-hopene/tetraprenyl-beta-curcumene cyclase